MKKFIVLLLLALLLPVGVAVAAQVQWLDNGHYYERVDGSFTWADANTDANGKSYLGLQGHLVTITSAEENLFLTNDANLGDGNSNLLHSHWTGGFQPPGSTEPDGGWSWVTGEAFSYSNWELGEPNDSGATEDRIIFDHGIHSDGKAWNDLTGTVATAGYVVEYESTAVPLPSAFLLFAPGLAGLAAIRRRFTK
ncbi:MAG: lectin-like protein [Proteobacteria bacterium]|nr:lectin-like protein [Pseudomonadota bacterium]